MSVDEREEIFRNSNHALQETLQNQLAAHRNMNQRAIDLVKIDLLAASVVVSGISLSGTSAVASFLAASTLSFLYSIWTSVRVFRPRHFSRGLGSAEVDRIKRAADSGITSDVHHDQMLLTYRDAVAENSNEYLTEALLFGNAVWASVTGVSFAAIAAVAVVVVPPLGTVPFAYVVVLVACLWGKEQYGFEENEEL